VSVVDTQVANALLQAAKAVRLLGADVVLTGIRPEVAQTLVGLGVELTDIVTRGTLQAGIRYAMEEKVTSSRRTR
jgi:anti-anti-sigma regulatory factor